MEIHHLENRPRPQNIPPEGVPPLTKNHKCDKLDSDARSAADFLPVSEPPHPSNYLQLTDIRESIHSPSRVNIFIAGEFAFSLDISQVVDFGLKVGKFLSPEEIENLKNASEFGKLYSSTLEWVLTRPHSTKETRDYLVKKKYKRAQENRSREQAKIYKAEHKSENPYKNPDNLDERGRLKFKNSPWAKKTDLLPEISDENIERVMSRLLERGYLDDEKFAKYYVENRRVAKGASRRLLEQELQKKGISRSIIETTLSDSSRDDAEEIKKIIIKKRKKYQDDNKLINYLVRQGFDYQFSRNLVLEKD